MILVALGGVIGSLFRYTLNELFGSDQTGVMLANLIGVAVAGLAVVYFKSNTSEKLRQFVLPGFCGGLTTFSSVILLSDKHGYAYLLENLFLSILVIQLVMQIAKDYIARRA